MNEHTEHRHHHSGGSRGAGKTSFHRRKHRGPRRKSRIIGSILICLAVLLAGGGIIYSGFRKQKYMQAQAGNSYDVGSGYRNIVYNGKEYTYNNRITCILYAGIDSEGTMEATVRYGDKGRADTIGLVIMDEYHKKFTILGINRDTMTQIRRYSKTGNDDGLYTSHIGYAYTYGDGGKVSCESLCEAVSLLLGNIPVREYVVTNRDSLPYLNDLVGGITVTVPNDDLAEMYPSLYEGAVVTLDDDNVTEYLQYRDTESDFSNEGRMERQKSYIQAYIQEIQQMTEGQLIDGWDSLESIDDYLQTSITRSQYLSLADTLQKMEFTEDDFIQIEGTDQQGELHDEFYPDEDKLQEKIIELFYLES